MKRIMQSGITAYRVKIIAVIFITVDHLASYGGEIPIFGKYSFYMRAAGRLAAPLFLFLITESVHHTRNQARFAVRLYAGAVWVGLFMCITRPIGG